MNVSAYEQITGRIIALLQQGTVPWRKPWTARTSLPRNLVSKKPYRGINVFVLLAMGYESPFWLTFRQAVKLGGSVKRGERGCPVVFWKPLLVDDRETGEEREIPLLRYYHVVNSQQCEGFEDAVIREIGTARIAHPIARPAEIVAGMRQKPFIRHGMVQAAYWPREDIVNMPSREQFVSGESYYTTLFHELVHATGHEKRLNRSTLMESAGFGSDPYCKEELIAEMSAAFLCGYAEIVDRTIVNSAAYIQEWLKRLQNDKTLVVQAAAQAQKAADFILGKDRNEQPPAQKEVHHEPAL